MKVIILISLFLSLTALADSQTYTDYEGGVRIQDKGVSIDFYNPLDIAKKIKDEAQADWVEISTLRQSYDPMKQLVGMENSTVPFVIKFTIKKDDNYYFASCSGWYDVKIDNAYFSFENRNCNWWSKGRMGNLYDPFKNKKHEDGVFVTRKPFIALNCEYVQLLGWANGNEVGIDYTTSTVGKQIKKTMYISTQADFQTNLGKFGLEYKASSQVITLAETDPQNTMLKTFPHYETALVKSGMFQNPEVFGGNYSSVEIPQPGIQTKTLAISRGIVGASEGHSLPYEIRGSCTLK